VAERRAAGATAWLEVASVGYLLGQGVGGGAGPILGDITWTASTGPEGEAFAVDPYNL
jgi:hypothetical protein